VPFLFLVAWREGSLPKLAKWRELPFLLLLGMVGVALPQTLIFVCNKLAGPAIIAVLSPAAPVWAALLATSFKLELMTRVKAFGILLAVSGAFVVLRPDTMTFGQPTELTAGVFLMIFQTMCYASFLVALKIRLATRPYPFGIYAFASLLGLAMIALFSLFTGLAAFDPSLVPKSAWGAVVYCGIVVSFWAHAWNSWAVSKTSASIPALFSCLSPFLTGFLSYLVLNETIGSASDIMGLALNVAGACSQKARQAGRQAGREAGRQAFILSILPKHSRHITPTPTPHRAARRHLLEAAAGSQAISRRKRRRRWRHRWCCPWGLRYLPGPTHAGGRCRGRGGGRGG
jgi:drug/metabolite transporter (DMT)-like permease